ncbi:MAG: hypothetical protein JF599_08325 [Verrucomicrobia bacterium]|nr:hypothetical protein [Verrucomicrobiota bacterium]
MNKNLYDKLNIAFQQKGRVRDILTEALQAGIPREHALLVLEQIYREACQCNNEAIEDAVVDWIDVLKFYCNPRDYIWMPEQSSPSEEQS